jgi:flagellar assembly protein FliH
MSGKVIPAGEARVVPWQVPEVGAGDRQGARVAGLPTAGGLERLQKQAYEEGYAQGREEGRAAGREETAARGARLGALLGALARPFEELDEQVEQELVRLALAIAQQLVRREIKADPGQIVAIVRDALAVLPVSARGVRLHLHPEDAKLVHEVLSVGDAQRPWQIVEDPVLARGGCRVVSESSRIDASLEARLAALAAAVLGGEREDDG